MAENVLYYGDNLEILREHIAAESVDLIYLDPPFKSNQTYNVLFKEKNGSESAAQIRAFEDTWHWDDASAKAYHEVVEAGLEAVSKFMKGMRAFIGTNDMLAYLSMMAPRLVELRRVLKTTGSIYLHCDTAASHFLKLLMDAAFGGQCFQNEVIWKRTSAHSSAKRCGPVHDSILYYVRSSSFTWNPSYQAYDPDYIETFFDQRDPDGTRWKRTDLTGSGVRHGATGEPWRGRDVTAKGRHWMYPPEMLDKLNKEGRIHWPKKKDGMPRLKQYPRELPGVPLQDVWTDIRPMHNLAPERLGYPTQKPEALLERIIQASSNEGDMVLDPFCGCGTTIRVAHELKRRWIGIDITHLAVGLMRRRLRDAFGPQVDEAYHVVGVPKDLASARALAKQDRIEFQRWVLGEVGAGSREPKRGADKGIDGRLYFHDEGETRKAKTKQIVLQVKSGHTGARDIRDLRGVLEREKAEMGVFITLQEPTKPMRTGAASAGFYTAPDGSNYPRLQILTVADLLQGKRIAMPPWSEHRTFKKAPRAKRRSPRQAGLSGMADD